MLEYFYRVLVDCANYDASYLPITSRLSPKSCIDVASNEEVGKAS